ncbi:hypothetical protein, partial [Haloarcula argentinensis]
YSAAQGREFLRNELENKSNEFVREFAGMINDPDVLDFLNRYCGIYEERGKDFLDSHVGKQIVRSAATSMVDRAYREGNVSQLQGMVGIVNQDREASDALTEIVTRLAQEGTIAVVTGPPGAGKTATTLDVARAWGARTGGTLYGQTTWDGFDAVVRSDVEMLEAMASHKRQSLGVLDEAMQELTGRGADSKKAETFAERATLIRKKEDRHGPHAKRGSLVLVAHNWSGMNKPIREMTTLVIQKPSRADPGRVILWESPGGEDKREKIGEFVGLTDTRESYSEHDPAPFRVVLDEDRDDDADQIDPEQIRRAERVRAYLLDCQPWCDGGISQGDAAAKQGFSSSWATDRKQEWESGEWNHLDGVPEPSKVETA